MQEKDICRVAALERECFSDAWSENSLRELAGRPCFLFLVAEEGEDLAGSCCAQIVLDEAELLRVSVRAARRRKGIARSLLQALEVQNPQVCVWNLEVRAGNAAARSLYRRCGFTEIGRRKKYYRNPPEDAIRMQRKGKGEVCSMSVCWEQEG